MTAPTSSADFDSAYRSRFTPWGDVRIPKQLKALIKYTSPRSSLEIGCGLGRFSAFMARSGVRAVGVDFSPVAIEKAKTRVADEAEKPKFFIADVTRLAEAGLTPPFDVSFDIGCFHCLGPNAQRAYVAQLSHMLKPGGTHLIWAIDSAPGDVKLSPDVVARVFAPSFVLRSAEASRRRFVASHWYWLERAS